MSKKRAARCEAACIEYAARGMGTTGSASREKRGWKRERKRRRKDKTQNNTQDQMKARDLE